MKLWIDDVRPAPEGYIHIKSVNSAKRFIEACEWDECEHGKISFQNQIELINIDHDAGQYVSEGGDYINLLNWLEETSRNYPICIHSQNPVGVANMRRIIERNGWKEVESKGIDRSRCNKCVYELYCSKDKDKERKCPDYKCDAPDGGYYG